MSEGQNHQHNEFSIQQRKQKRETPSISHLEVSSKFNHRKALASELLNLSSTIQSSRASAFHGLPSKGKASEK